MLSILKKIFLWIYIQIHSLLINISISLYSVETEILTANPNITDERNKHVQRMRNRSNMLESFYAGKRDEKINFKFYTLLKKADAFIRTATPRKMAIAADKHKTSYGMKDQYGRRYEHYGFYDEKHKHSGKTIGEVLEMEMEERRTKDDNYELLNIYNNKPIEVGLVNVIDVLEKTSNDEDSEYKVVDISKKSKQFKFPIKIVRDNEDVINKIEQLTEFLHIKKIGLDHRQLEFFIPNKYKTKTILEDSETFKELASMKNIYVKNDYGESISFMVNSFIKRVDYNDTHEVWKFEGVVMETVNLY